MRAIRGIIVATCLLSLTLLPTQLSSQSLYHPNPMDSLHIGMFADSLFSERVGAFVLGHQWGPADLDKLNTALRMNVTCDNYGYMHTMTYGLTGELTRRIKTDSAGRLYDAVGNLYNLGPGKNDTNFVIWAQPLIDVWNNADFTGRWLGMRWDPAEISDLTAAWQPRDTEAWPLGFGARHHGSVPTSGENYRRFVLTRVPGLTYPVRVLDSVEPRNAVFIRDNEFDWRTPWADTSFSQDSSEARRLQLVVNLRRVSVSDTVTDDSVVASVVVPYQMRWKQQGNVEFKDSSRHRMPFRLIPANDRDSAFDLPQGRGLELPMRSPPGGYCDSILITRRMLPTHSEAGGPDITLVAEFRTDQLLDQFGEVMPRLLKTGLFNFPGDDDDDSTLVIQTSSGPDSSRFNKRYKAIDTLGVTVWYHGTTTSVAIRSVALLTPQTKRAVSGYHDQLWADSLKKQIDSIAKIQQIVKAATGRTIKLLGFYMCDEFNIEHLVGMRYRLDLLGGRLTSETGYGGVRTYDGNAHNAYGPHLLQGFPSNMLWTAGFAQTTRATARPYASRGGMAEVACETCTPPLTTLGYKLGFKRAPDMNNAPYRAYETAVKTNFYISSYETVNAPFPTTPNNYTTDAVYQTVLHSDQAEVGYMAHHEITLFINAAQTPWFFEKRRDWWSNFFYHLDPKYRLNNANPGVPYVTYDKFAPITGEEVRLQHGTALMFGCRGFMYDKWRHGYRTPPLASDYLTEHRIAHRGKQVYPSGDPSIPFTAGDATALYFPGYVAEDSTAYAWDTSASVSPDSLLRSPHIGGDYVTYDDPFRFNSWVGLGSIASDLNVSHFMRGSTSENVYIGRKSVQMESKWWHDLVTDTATMFRRGSGLSNAEIFMKTRPIGWYGRGYRVLRNGDSARLGQWIDLQYDTVRMYRWRRASITDTSLVMETEPIGERFFDVVLLDLQDSVVSDTDCIITVTNRRTSPFVFDNSTADSVEFWSSYDFDTLTRSSRPEIRYQQVGARRISLPFRYRVDESTPYLFRIRELVPAYDSNYAIDTVVGMRSRLTLDFRPGETKFLRVTRMPAQVEMSRGYLAFNTQNKMVLAPVAKADHSGYTDSVRYHMAFHRRDTDPSRNGPWTVFYQRSKAFHKDSLPHLADTSNWENPVRLSRLTTSSITMTDGLNRTLYFAVDSAAYLNYFNDPVDAAKDCCCGFPSIVVREVAPNVPKVFVVYACEDEWVPGANDKRNFFVVAENSFLDQAQLPGGLDAQGRALVICPKDLPHDGGVDTLKSLARYGTPAINASANSNMFYAWSSSGFGVGAGRKLATQDWFPAYNAVVQVPVVNIITQDNLVIGGGSPRYPTLNVYSNISQGHEHATLVWEEGTTNNHLRYTRLRPGVGTAIERFLPDFRQMHYDGGTPPSIPINVPQAIAVIGGASTDEEARLPVVIRSLQADTLSFFERDLLSDTSTYTYNHESVIWEEWKPSQAATRIRYNHFLDLGTAGNGTLRYWWANTTYGTGMSLFHPVVENAVVRLDSMTWQGVVDTTLVTYADSLHLIRGNVSDSALIVNYSVLSAAEHADLRVDVADRNATYWTGSRRFDDMLTQQIIVRRMPGVPGSPSPILHPDFLIGEGAWPHLSLRQREDLPVGINAVRRLLQSDNGNAPELSISAEQFYKPARREPPMQFGGFETHRDKVSVAAVLSDGLTLTMKPRRVNRATFELASEPFTVGNIEEIRILSTGSLRDDIVLVIEEVDGRRAGRSTALYLAQADERKPEAVGRARMYLTRGEQRTYRLRMTYTGQVPVIYHEDTDISPEKETFDKSTSTSARIVDLMAMRTNQGDVEPRIQVFPNPSSADVTILYDRADLSLSDASKLEIIDQIGRAVYSTNIQNTDSTRIASLPTGTYIARLGICATMFMVVQ